MKKVMSVQLVQHKITGQQMPLTVLKLAGSLLEFFIFIFSNLMNVFTCVCVCF